MAVLALAVGVKAWGDTLGEPVVQRTAVAAAGLPAGSAPVTIALISDIHVAGPDMPPERLSRIVAQLNALEPDLVAIAGDFVSEKGTATHVYTPEEVVAPLAELSAPLGVVAVLGNHDHWFDDDGLREELETAGLTVLVNEAAQFGPLALGGLDDAYTGRDDVPAMLDAMEGLAGARIVLSHSPDPFPDLPEDVVLTMAGHTHCGQIAYPWGGAPAHLSEHGDRYGCGRVDENGKTLIVGPGLGTSLIPLRLFTKPTIWLIELVPEG